MIDLGPHVTFILASYIGVALVVAALIVRIAFDSNQQKKKLARLEAMGIKRRSAEPKV